MKFKVVRHRLIGKGLTTNTVEAEGFIITNNGDLILYKDSNASRLLEMIYASGQWLEVTRGSKE